MYWRVMKFFQTLKRAPNGCVEWIGYKGEKGYGETSWDGKRRKATHVSWFIKHGRWPVGLMLHHCDNPACVKIDHLYEGTYQDNARDMVARERHLVKVTNKQVQEIRDLGKTRTPIKAIAAQYGIHPMYVSNILCGRSRGAVVPRLHKPYARHKNARRVEFCGEMLTYSEIAERAGLEVSTVHNRHLRGITGHDLGAPPHQTKRKNYTRQT